MGKKIRSKEVSVVKGRMRHFCLLSFVFLLGLASSIGVGEAGISPSKTLIKTDVQLSLQFQYELSKEPLTTQKIWTLDSKQKNPHRQRWVLNRNTQIKGLRAVPVMESHKKIKFGLQAFEIVAQATGYLRPSGNWYQNFDQFDCQPKPNSWFQTQEGAKKAVSTAAQEWSKLLEKGKLELELVLERLNADSEELALKKGEKAFQLWLADLDYEWRQRVGTDVRNQEWKDYQEDAALLKLCGKGKNQSKKWSVRSNSAVALEEPLWASMMEPLEGKAPPITKVLARAPARRWDGLYSVRLNIRISDKVLNGQFLIDSAAPQSIISPDWLVSQGIVPAWAVIPKRIPKRVALGGLWESETRLAQQINVDQVDLSGLNIPLREFLLAETFFFGPPDHIRSCCDGVLGVDFLELFPIEFRVDPPYELRIWPKEDFQWERGTPWVEVSQMPDGYLTSPCRVTASTPVTAENLTNSAMIQTLNGEGLVGVLWQTALEDALLIHPPWEKQFRKSNPSPLKVTCDSMVMGSDFTPVFSDIGSENRADGKEFLKLKTPAVSIGMANLSQGGFTFDLPHGRFWFSKELSRKKSLAENTTGLDLVYVLKNGERILKVREIVKTSATDDLIQAGLKPGAVITQINAKEPGELDLWEVEKILGGEYGGLVSLQWRVRGGVKVAPLKISHVMSEEIFKEPQSKSSIDD